MAKLVYSLTLVCFFHYGSTTYSQYGGRVSGGSHGGDASYGGRAYQGPLAAPVVLGNGYLADTREVAAAKNAHYSALSSAKASSGYGGGYGSGYAGGYGGSAGYGSGASYAGGAYNGPLAAPVVLPTGYLADTREVASAKNAHYSALLSAKSSSGYGNGLGSGYGGGFDGGFGSVTKSASGGSYGGGAGYGSGSDYGGGAYSGPLAAPVVLSSGYFADTRDVAAAKGAHYVALSVASSRSGYGGYSGSQGKGWH